MSTAGVGVGVGVQGGAGDGQEVGESRILVAAGAGGELVEGGGADVEVVPFTKRVGVSLCLPLSVAENRVVASVSVYRMIHCGRMLCSPLRVMSSIL